MQIVLPKMLPMNAAAMIKEYLNKNGISITFLAEKINESQPNVTKKLKKKDLSTDFIERVCVALNHNFFKDLANVYEQEKLSQDWKGEMYGEKTSEILTVQEEQSKYNKLQDMYIDHLKREAEKKDAETNNLKKDIEEIKKEIRRMNEIFHKENKQHKPAKSVAIKKTK